MRNKQKTPRGDGSRTGFKSLHRGEIRQEDDSKTSHALQGKCARCPYFPGRGYACNVPCPFTVRGACAACVHFLPVNEHRNKARCLWTGERLDAGEAQWVRECIGFEKKTGEGLTSGMDFRHGECPQIHMRRSNRLSCFPRAGKSIAAYSACLAAGIFIGRLAHIGGVVTSSIREDWRPHMSRGALLPRLFFLIPKSYEVPHA